MLRDIVVTLDMRTSEVVKASCSCPAGQSGYCNHVMALLLKIASFSLQGTSEIPHEVACTSVARQWGVPGDKQFPKAPVMSTTIRKQPNKRGITSTFYDPRKNWDVESFHEKVKKFKLELWEENP